MARAEQRQAERGSIVMMAAVDWITLTTREGRQYELAKKWITDNAGTRIPKTAKSYQFDIENVDFASYGEGSQDGQPIFIVAVNGSDADNFMEYLIASDTFLSSEWHCTRIDIQLTVPSTRTKPLAEIAAMHNYWKEVPFNDVKAKARVRGWGSDTGGSMYIGAPTSMLQIRIYDKSVVLAGETLIYERMEAQLREEYAQSMFISICKNRMRYNRKAILSSLKYYHNRLPLEMQSLLSQSPHLDNVLSVQAERITTDKQERAKVKWALNLRNSLLELASEDTFDGYRIRAMLTEVLVLSLSEDKTTYVDDWQLRNSEGVLLDPLTYPEET